ncbi:protein phosphatase 1 regulatory subunit 12A [Canna indica]|uniref:Protein phosphatase 1 regulatory subunit 12A n=1 Tax=Canna indica TaxID=4628 RepID=A0AAQ3QM54_9LILI|nr:protein phosphatase 1 regulatory subunit 12A [Canna indica]
MGNVPIGGARVCPGKMPDAYFPLRWESTGDQWWYASPIDWAAANGHYDLVRELLHLDINLLIKLTSLRRIRRLETVWDDDARFVDAAKCRSFVARNLFRECERKNKKNTLIRAGYGGWLLYTAASAGDMSFVQELLDRDPLFVFGEGEYGVTDIFYASARSKNSKVFRLLFDFAVSPRCSISGGGGGAVEGSGGSASGFRWEMVNRAVHAAARGGNLEFLKELLADCSDVLAYRDTLGSTILHTASGRGQVEVVKDLIKLFEIIDSRDNQGNTALHVAAFRGYLLVVEALITASPSISSLTNNFGDTFLHMAVAGFRTPGFRRLDRQMELMKQLVNGTCVNIQDIINVKNNDGRTALHMAVIGNVHTDLVQILMTIRSVDLNARDLDGMTPLDILRQHPRSASSEILIKQLISAGGIANSKNYKARSVIASHLKMQGIDPGTLFRISDAEILLYAGIEPSDPSGRPSSCSTASKSEVTHLSATDEIHGSSDIKKQNPVRNAARNLKILLRWSRRKEKKSETPKKIDVDDSFDSFKKLVNQENTPTPLRQQFSKETSLVNNKRIRTSAPSPTTKKKFAAGLVRGVIEAMPHLAPSGAMVRTPSSLFSDSSIPSPTMVDKEKGICLENENDGASCSSSSINVTPRSSLVNTRLMNQYLCFGAQELGADDSGSGQQSNHAPKRSLVSVV